MARGLGLFRHTFEVGVGFSLTPQFAVGPGNFWLLPVGFSIGRVFSASKWLSSWGVAPSSFNASWVTARLLSSLSPCPFGSGWLLDWPLAELSWGPSLRLFASMKRVSSGSRTLARVTTKLFLGSPVSREISCCCEVGGVSLPVFSTTFCGFFSGSVPTSCRLGRVDKGSVTSCGG